MTLRIQVDRAAATEIRQHALFIELEGGPGASDRFIDGVERTFSFLSQHPFVGRRWFTEETVRVWSASGLRSYLIFYRVEPDTLRILHVMHASQDNMHLVFDDH